MPAGLAFILAVGYIGQFNLPKSPREPLGILVTNSGHHYLGAGGCKDSVQERFAFLLYLGESLDSQGVPGIIASSMGHAFSDAGCHKVMGFVHGGQLENAGVATRR